MGTSNPGSYCTADLHLCFLTCILLTFFCSGSNNLLELLKTSCNTESAREINRSSGVSKPNSFIGKVDPDNSYKEKKKIVHILQPKLSMLKNSKSFLS